MWASIAALAASLGAGEPEPYPGLADPIAFMAARYGEYRRGHRPALATDGYASERLRRHLYAFDEAAGGQELDSLDFWIDDRDDWALSGLGLTLERRCGGAKRGRTSARPLRSITRCGRAAPAADRGGRWAGC